MTPILDRYRLTPGLPIDGAPGQFLGVDTTGNLWLLRRHRRGEWNALGYEEGIGADHPALRRGLDLKTLIVGHIMGPPLGQGPGITFRSAGFPPLPAGDVEGAAGEMNGTAADDRHPVGDRALGHPDPEILPADDEAAYPLVREAVVANLNATASFIQRRYQIGFFRAARFIERMEAEGVISAWDAYHKRRTILASKQVAHG